MEATLPRPVLNSRRRTGEYTGLVYIDHSRLEVEVRLWGSRKKRITWGPK